MINHFSDSTAFDHIDWIQWKNDGPLSYGFDVINKYLQIIQPLVGNDIVVWRWKVYVH